MAHLSCVGATADELRGTLDKVRAAGIDNVLALRGDPPAGETEWRPHPGGLHYSTELAGLHRQRLRDGHRRRLLPRGPPRGARHGPRPALPAREGPRRRQLPHHPALLRQPALLRLRRRGARGRDRRPDHPRDHPDHQRRPDQALHPALRRVDPRGPARGARRATPTSPTRSLELGVAYATLQCADLLARGAPGIHFYVLNKAPSARAILGALRLQRPWERSRPERV